MAPRRLTKDFIGISKMHERHGQEDRPLDPRMSLGDGDQQIRIPDTLAHWPWERKINPYYHECRQKSEAWVESLNAFGPKSQKAFNKGDFSLLGALAFADLDKDGCQLACDLMNLFFIFDEWSDASDAEEARRQADAIMDALKNPLVSRPEGEWIGGEAARQFWLDAQQIATASAQKHFIHAFQHYADAVVQQAVDRNENRIRNLEDYFAVRRRTIGARPSFVFNRLYDEDLDDCAGVSSIVSLEECCTDMMIIGNDLCSYNVEQSRGDDAHNLVTVVMNQFKYGTQQAFDWIGRLHDEISHKFMAHHRDVIQTASAGRDPGTWKTYANALGNWVRANDTWHFETNRYFGHAGSQVKNTRRFSLLPKADVRGPLD